MKWTDDNIDNLFQSTSDKLKFEYKQSYWDEFNASLPDSAMSAENWSDNRIDSLFQESASKLQIPYRKKYWIAFNASLPVFVPSNGGGDMADSTIDAMFNEGAEDLSFQYKADYWNEMEAMLPRKRKPDFLWFGAAFFFIGLLSTAMFMHSTGVQKQSHTIPTAQSEKGNAEDVVVQKDNDNTKLSAIEPTDEVVNKTTNGINSNSYQENNTVFDDLAEGRDVNEENNDQHSNGDQDVQGASSTSVSTIKAELAFEINMDEMNVVNPHLSVDTENEVNYSLNRLNPNELTLAQFNSSLVPVNPYVGGRAHAGFYVQGVGGLSQSLITPSDKLYNSFGLGAGVEVSKGSWSFGLGANGIVQNHNDLQLTRMAKVYGFGSDIYMYNLDYKQIYTLEGVLNVGYHIGRHQVNLGVRPSYVLSSRVRIEELAETNSLVGGTIDDGNNTRQVFGYMEGIKRFGVKPTIGYAYSFRQGMSLGVNFGVQLMPSINEDYIDGINNTLPIDGQIYFRKTFSFK